MSYKIVYIDEQEDDSDNFKDFIEKKDRIASTSVPGIARSRTLIINEAASVIRPLAHLHPSGAGVIPNGGFIKIHVALSISTREVIHMQYAHYPPAWPFNVGQTDFLGKPFLFRQN